MDIFTIIADAGVGIATLGLMLWYLTKRDRQTARLADSGHAAVNSLARAVSDQTTEMARQNELLRQVVQRGEEVSS